MNKIEPRKISDLIPGEVDFTAIAHRYPSGKFHVKDIHKRDYPVGLGCLASSNEFGSRFFVLAVSGTMTLKMGGKMKVHWLTHQPYGDFSQGAVVELKAGEWIDCIPGYYSAEFDSKSHFEIVRVTKRDEHATFDAA